MLRYVLVSSTDISVDLTGIGPWSITYTDGVTPVTVSNIASSPYVFTVNPATTTTYYTIISDRWQLSEYRFRIGYSECYTTSCSIFDANCIRYVKELASAIISRPLIMVFTGTWEPSTINTMVPGTTTYVFTTSVSTCVETVSMDITIKPITRSTTNVTVCSGQMPYSWNNNVYTRCGNL